MKLLPALLILLALPVSAFSADKAKEDAPSASTKKVNLSEFKFGKTLSGEEVTAESLKGKPVVVDFWGVNCPPCLAAIPSFNTLAKRYESKGLKVVGAESQQTSEEEIAAMVKKLRIKFPVTAGASHPLNFSGLPHTAVFAADGALLFEGHPDDKEFDRAVKAALKSATPVEKP